ncbi:uncharacterized protein LOC127847875 [Dreissena polymorpha]|uniref:Cas1p 10 TM acyl transferase domain-containing protein n=1 Tax=Dreissena polymorpha TaxID=45954 RepID=A0A9D4DQ31_DREPO|nr:uncharacterized protein LOC127847875 [Dreissena polymorpha]XP_052236051.1 uncharacterized protein LOC127847875 [Dreissena polymorpha]KAH3752761.1 hypothetical protein DPMN_187387 [Dreissena polymorpha]
MDIVINRSLSFMTRNNTMFDPHTKPHYDVTSGQITFFVWWVAFAVVYLLRKLDISPKIISQFTEKHIKSDEDALTEVKSGIEKIVQISDRTESDIGHENKHGETQTNKPPEKTFSKVIPPPSLDEVLQNVLIFGGILIYFFLCDYRKIFPMLERVYDRDEFLFLVFVLFLVACAFTLRPTSEKILNRAQTEEWKGWMQVMFVWYHVFAAKEWYNWIRVYIAAYVWMTGFGNFSFFWVRKDFSLYRFLKMQFRLNFLVTCVCVVTGNEYMLYYICAMHSYWFISVYLFMGVLRSWNTDSKKMAVKFLAYFIFNFVIFDISVVADTIFKPFSFLLGYTDPNFGVIHEWTFRAGLDHWACFFGMLCAYNYPHFEKFLTDLEKSENYRKAILTKVVLIAGSIIALVVWYVLVMGKEKHAYNALHPYTSMIPIASFIILRNSFPILRKYYIHLFAFLGKITLETYLSQLHIYLQSNAKHLIGYLPNHHFLNFAFATIIYLLISHKLFDITTILSAFLIPNDTKRAAKHAVVIFLAFVVTYACAVAAGF